MTFESFTSRYWLIVYLINSSQVFVILKTYFILLASAQVQSQDYLYASLPTNCSLVPFFGFIGVLFVFVVSGHKCRDISFPHPCNLFTHSRDTVNNHYTQIPTYTLLARARTHAHTHTHTRTHARTHARTHTHTRTHTHARTQTHTHIHTRTHARTYTPTSLYTHCCRELRERKWVGGDVGKQGRQGTQRQVPSFVYVLYFLFVIYPFSVF